MAKQRSNDPRRAASLAGAAPAGERRQGLRAVGAAVSGIAAPIAAKRGGGILVRLKTSWAAIVGEDWAAASWPAALGRDGALRLRTTPAAALEVQHRAPLLIERINLYFGRAVVSRLTQVQGPLPLATPPVSRPPPRLTAAQAAALDEQLSQVADSALRAALARLGAAILGAGG
jgi:hypothetical protein